jgi:ABC-type Fe3+-hydroxamate transport system substrate-binding protein
MMPIIFQGEEIKKSYNRIVSVVPSQTELLFDLGLDEEVLGITKFCIHPDEWFHSKTRIGGTKKLNIEKIRALQPELVLANKEENLKNEIEAIAEFTNVYVSDIETFENALKMIEEIGALTNKQSEANKINEDIRAAFDSFQSKQKRKAAYFIWKDPYMSIGNDTFIHIMMEYAGFENVFTDEKRYPEISIEKLKAAAPEVILLSSEPYPFKQEHAHELKEQFPTAEILLVDGEMFSWYGSRLLDAPRYFESLNSL